MYKSRTQHIVFRLVFPVVFGILAYLIVLMIFDSVRLIIDNFFSKEVAFFVVLSFALFESLDFAYRVIGKNRLLNRKPKLRLTTYIISSIAVSVIIVSFFVNLYFRLIEETGIFRQELIIFNFIMLFASILYLSVHYSIDLIRKHTEKALEIENLQIENLQKRLRILKHNIQPEILFESLETLILLIYKDEKLADNFIDELSEFYRTIIEERNTEIISMKEEINATKKLLNLLNTKYENKISISANLGNTEHYFLVPGIIRRIVFTAAQNNLISEKLPLKIMMELSGNSLHINYNTHKKLNIKESKDLDDFIEKYKRYSDKEITEHESNSFYEIKIPLLTQI